MGRVLGIFRHAATMVRRAGRSYSLLSVTIVLSFSLLLGYLTLIDSQLYNQYKTVFAQNRRIITTFSTQMPQTTVELLVQKANQYGQTHSTQTMSNSLLQLVFQHLALETGEAVLPYFNSTQVVCIPDRVWTLSYEGITQPVTWLDGQAHPDIHLEHGEILMDEQLYYALGLSEGNQTVSFLLQNPLSEGAQKNSRFSGTFTVVGTIPSSAPMALEPLVDTISDYDYSIALTYSPTLVFNMEDLNPGSMDDLTWWTSLTFHTESPELVTKMIRSFDPELHPNAVYEAQDEALKVMGTEKRAKSLVAVILLLLLGINLYSSFTNALEGRKFEIGVKRAIGASRWAIIRQFLYEGVLVMVANIFLSVVIVTDLAMIYKVIREAIPDSYGDPVHFVLYISPHSVGIFAVCAVTLTGVFSLIFAYKSTQVQVVDYLKAE